MCEGDPCTKAVCESLPSPCAWQYDSHPARFPVQRYHVMTTLIFLGGEMPSIPLARSIASRASRIIAADSGYHAALHSGIQPHVLTGDFDSIESLPEAMPVEVIPAHEQDATDFEKALRQVPSGCSEIQILGGTGLRSDHFLTNLLIASGLPPAWAVTFHDDLQAIHRVTPDCPLALAVNPGAVISLIPFTSCRRVTTSGLHWNLDQADMGPPARLGQSNRAEAPALKVSLSAGVLYVVVNHPDGLKRPANSPRPQA